MWTTVLKKYLLQSITWIIFYFYPTGPFLLLIGFFIGTDTITGMIAANKRGETITSKRFMNVFRKYVVYGCAIFVAHVLQMQFFPDFPALKIISGLIAYNELMSIDENINSITGFSLFKLIIKKMKP